MTPTTYGRIEAGDHTRTRKLQGIAEAFSVPLEAVLHLQLSGWIEANHQQRHNHTDDISQLKAEIQHLRREIAAIRSGQATPATMPDAYGSIAEAVKRQQQQHEDREAESQKRTKKQPNKKKRAK